MMLFTHEIMCERDLRECWNFSSPGRSPLSEVRPGQLGIGAISTLTLKEPLPWCQVQSKGKRPDQQL